MKTRSSLLALLVLSIPIWSTGCYPFGMGIATPLPVMPWVTERMQDKFVGMNDHRTPILPAIPEGGPPPVCEDPPDKAAVLRAMIQVTRGVPYVYEEFRDDIEVVSERLVDRIDPPRFYPLIGPAQLHHCHWRCYIYYNETIQSNWPFPFQAKRPRVEVMYIDKDHLHLYVGPNQQFQGSVNRDLTGY